MDPQVEAAFIAAGVSLISLAGTVAVAIMGIQATRKVSADSIKAQREQLDTTLTTQTEQFNTTFAAQSAQFNTTIIEQSRQFAESLSDQYAATLNERFVIAAEKIGADKPSAARIAGVYAIAALADEWDESRQDCIDVLCGYLRVPSPPDFGDTSERWQYQADREVRHTIIHVIRAHLIKSARVPWNNKNFDFRGMILDGGDFSEVRFSGGLVNFTGAEFRAGYISFKRADFTGADVLFDDAVFSGGTVSFEAAKFRGGMIRFSGSQFSGGNVYFQYAEFSGGTVRFDSARISAGIVSFGGAKLSGGKVYFWSSGSSGGILNFGGFYEDPRALADGAEFRANASVIVSGTFNGTQVSFNATRFGGGHLSLVGVSKWDPPPEIDQELLENPSDDTSSRTRIDVRP
jgi:hypothetical protein